MSDVATIYEHEYPCVFRYCLKRVSNWHVAEDLTSATFEVALLRLPHPNPHALLLSIAHHKILNYWQREHKRATLVFSDRFTDYDLDRYVELSSTDDPIEKVIDACDTAMAAAMLRATLKQCSEQDLQIIDLRFVQQLPAKTVAASFGLTPQEYNKRQSALFYRLAQRLNPVSNTRGATCLVCDSLIYGRGLCHYHYQQSREGKRIPMLPPKAEYRPTTCQECGKPHYSRGYCRRHYEQMRCGERMQARHAVSL